MRCFLTPREQTSSRTPRSGQPFRRSGKPLQPLKQHQRPTGKERHARRAKRPRQGWRGRSAGMREPFAIGHAFPDPAPQPPARVFFTTQYKNSASRIPRSGSPSRLSGTPPHLLKPHQSPTGQECDAWRAKRPRQGGRGRSAGMRASFALGHVFPDPVPQPSAMRCFLTPREQTSSRTPRSGHPSRRSGKPLQPLKQHQRPTGKERYARRAKRPRQGGRGRSAGMRASFALGHVFPDPAPQPSAMRCFLTPREQTSARTPRSGYPSRLSGKPIQPLKQHQRPTGKERYARRAKRPRQRCGNPLRSGTPFLTLRLCPPRCVVFSHHANRFLPEQKTCYRHAGWRAMEQRHIMGEKVTVSVLYRTQKKGGS